MHATAEDILKNYREIRDSGGGNGSSVPKLWDSKAAERITTIIADQWAADAKRKSQFD